MDWDCWTRAFSAIYSDPSDAKRELKEFHRVVVATRLVLVSHEASLGVTGERERTRSNETGGRRRRPRTPSLH